MNKNLLKPIVSVLCLTYNQKEYVRQCLDGFLMQKTNFEYEILINDDASNDGTTEVLKEYQKKYPKIISIYTHSVNQYSKNANNMYVRYLFPKAKGRYIALCDGDDYWTDPNKLQRQVDFLEKNQDYSMCFHPVKVVFENHEEPDSIYPINDNKDDFTLKELLKSNFIQTNSVMYRKQNYVGMELDVMPGDWYMHLYHAQFGKIGFINKTMSVYRRQPNGIWWESYHNQNKFWAKNGLHHLVIYSELLKMFGENEEYRTIILDNAARDASFVIEADDSKNGDLINKIANNYPEYIKKIVINADKTIKDYDTTVKSLIGDIDSIEKDNTTLKARLEAVENSRSWKITKPMRSILAFLKELI